MDDLISRQAAIEAVKAIKFGLWEIDIPSPSVPEYREHHEQVTELMGVCDCWIKKLTEYQSVQPRTGHWEWVQYDSNPNIGNWHCSECRRIVLHMPEELDNTPIYKWCPMCGAKMEEVKA